MLENSSQLAVQKLGLCVCVWWGEVVGESPWYPGVVLLL
jgi:hypothetical protein